MKIPKLVFAALTFFQTSLFAQNTTIQPDKLTTKTIQITENAGNGRVLMSDNAGNANWADAAKFRAGFSVYTNSKQSFPVAFPKIILFEDESFDINNHFENSNFIPTEAGVYYFGANLSWQAEIFPGAEWHATVVEIRVTDNNNITKTIASNTLSLFNNNTASQQITCLANLNIGDKIFVTVASLGNSGSTLELSSHFSSSYFYGFRVF